MTYQEALKQITAKKGARDNYMIVKFHYHIALLLPYKDAIGMLMALQAAEKIKNGYSDPTRILPLEPSDIEVQFLSYQEYDRIRIASLLNIPMKDLDGVIEQETAAEST